MKIFNWIDSLFDTKAKRVLWLIVLVSIYWFWTDIWEVIFFVKLAGISDYESLFEFLNMLNRYDHTVLIGIVYFVVSNAGLTLKGILKVITYLDFLFFIGTGLVFLQKERKIHKEWLLISELLFLMGLMIFLITGFQAGTLSGVIGILRYMGFFGIGLKMIQIGIILFDLVKNIIYFIF